MASNYADRINSKAITLNDGVEEYSFRDIQPLLINNNDIVHVSYFSSKPNQSDWIGAYRKGANISLTSPIKFGLCSYGAGNSKYLLTGSSTLQFNLTNIRSEVVFHYFSNGFNEPIRQAQSQSVAFVNYNQPLRNRIVPTGDPNVLSLMWTSANSVTPTIQWGLSSGKYTTAVTAQTLTIDKTTSLCGGVASTLGWHDLGLIHFANITGIVEQNLANQKLYYIFGDNLTNDFSEEKIFFVPPSAGMSSIQRKEATTNFDTYRGTQVVLMADLGVGASDSTALSTAQVFSEACLPAFNTTKSIGHLVLQVRIDLLREELFLSLEISNRGRSMLCF